MVERAAERTLAELLEPATLLGLTHDHSGRCAGPITLGFAIDYTTLAPEPPPLVSHDPADASALETLCPPDDIADAHVSTRDRRFVVLSDEHDPLAGAGYDEFEGFLADTGVLTAPAQRRLGLGATALSLTADDALDQGLIPQLQWHRDNRAARALAERTGFDDVGSYVEVALGRPDNPPPDRPGTQPSEGTGSDD
nr:GNAT family N-acetyltransferase [Rhodococcus sp. HNM0569]